MIKFTWPLSLVALPLPLLVYYLLPRARGGGSGPALKVPFFAELSGLGRSRSAGGRRWRQLLAILAWLLLVAAATRPQWIGDPVALPVSGRDLLLAVDVSGSMKVKDMELDGRPVNRLTMIKKLAGDFIKRRRGDRVGLILFGTRAYLQAPLSLDRKTVNQLLQEAMIGIAGEKTAIGDAIGLAAKRLKERPGREKVLILLTDGANTAGTVPPLKAARLARELKIRIYTVGIGAERLAVDTFFGRRIVNPSADLDEKSLSEIAKITGGRYFRARDSAGMEKIYTLLDRLEPVVDQDRTLRPLRELFFWPLGAAFGLALLLLLVTRDEY